MEHTNEEKKIDKIRLFMVIGLYLAIAMLLITIITLVKNSKEIQTDPIIYGVEKKGFSLCVCYDADGNTYAYNATNQMVEDSWNVRLPS